MKQVSSLLKQIFETHIQEFDNENFAPAINEALEKGLLEEMLDVFETTDIPIPPTVLYECLYKKYIAASAKLSPQEKEKLKNKTCALINKQQVLLFKAMFE